MQLAWIGETEHELREKKTDDTCLMKSSLEVNDLISVSFEQSPVIRHLCHMRVVLHFLCSAGKLLEHLFFFMKQHLL